MQDGGISRRTDKLRERALEQIGNHLIAEGWTGDDLEGFVLTELGALLTDDPRLSADHLSRLLALKGKTLTDSPTLHTLTDESRSQTGEVRQATDGSWDVIRILAREEWKGD